MTELVDGYGVKQASQITVTVGRMDEHPALVYAASLSSAASRRTVLQGLTLCARLLTANDATWQDVAWAELRYQHLAALRAALIGRYAPTTCNRLLSAVRGVMKAAYLLGQIDHETYHKAVTVGGVKGDRLPSGRALTPDELARLLKACRADETAAGARDAALLALLFVGGLRRSEAASLDVSDVDPIDGRIVVRHGKGNKQRVVFVAGGALAAVQAWMTARGNAPGALFGQVKKGGVVVGALGLSVTAIYDVVVKRARQAGIASISPHDLRRTHMTNLLDAGADALLVSSIAGHSDPKTTARYDRRPEAAKRRAAELLDFPYEPSPLIHA